jgi:hypothetical protein
MEKVMERRKYVCVCALKYTVKSSAYYFTDLAPRRSYDISPLSLSEQQVPPSFTPITGKQFPLPFKVCALWHRRTTRHSTTRRPLLPSYQGMNTGSLYH